MEKMEETRQFLEQLKETADQLDKYLDPNHGERIGIWRQDDVRSELTDLRELLPTAISSLREAKKEELQGIYGEVDQTMALLKTPEKQSAILRSPMFTGIKTAQLRRRIPRLRQRIEKAIDDSVPFEIPEVNQGEEQEDEPPADAAAEGLMNILRDEKDKKIKAVVIHGSKGTGITARARKMWREIRMDFEYFAWVTVTQSSDAEEGLLREVINEFFYRTAPYALKHMKDNDLKGAIKDNKCLGGKRYLLVLDDVENKHWDILKPELPDDSGGRIILATHDELLYKNFSSEVRIEQPLPSAWDLFKKTAFPEGRCPQPPDLTEPPLENLVKKLGQPPPAVILTVATAVWKKMGGVTSARDILNESLNLQTSQDQDTIVPAKEETPEAYVRDALMWCYKKLSRPARLIFLYLSLFPQQEIKVKKTLRLCVAHGLVKGKEDTKTEEEVALEGFHELEEKKMVKQVRRNVTGTPKSCKIEYTHRNLANSVIKDQKHPEVYIINRIKDRLQRQQSIEAIHGIDPRCAGCLPQQPPTDFRNLRVWDLKGRKDISTLPPYVVRLVDLRYLGLRRTQIKKIPREISKLKKLQTLDIKGTKVRKLPHEVTALEELRHLLLASAFQSQVVELPLPDGTKLPRRLQTLAGVRATPSLVKQLGSCTQIRKLSIGRVTGGKVLETLCDSINKMRFLRSISIKCDGGERLRNLKFQSDNKISVLRIGGPVEPFQDAFENLSNLTRVYLWDNMLKEEEDFSVLQHLQKLKILSLSNAYRGSKINCNANGFPQLEKLSITRMESLKSVEIKNGGMPVLQELFIGLCPKMLELGGLAELPKLELVQVTEVPDGFVKEVEKQASRPMEEPQGLAANKFKFKVHSFKLLVSRSAVE